MDEYQTMTTQDAIKYIKEYFGIPSRYALAKSLSDDTLTVQPIQITNYIRGGKMSKKVAERFFETYGVIISDVHNPSDWTPE